MSDNRESLVIAYPQANGNYSNNPYASSLAETYDDGTNTFLSSAASTPVIPRVPSLSSSYHPSRPGPDNYSVNYSYPYSQAMSVPMAPVEDASDPGSPSQNPRFSLSSTYYPKRRASNRISRVYSDASSAGPLSPELQRKMSMASYRYSHGYQPGARRASLGSIVQVPPPAYGTGNSNSNAVSGVGGSKYRHSGSFGGNIRGGSGVPESPTLGEFALRRTSTISNPMQYAPEPLFHANSTHRQSTVLQPPPQRWSVSSMLPRRPIPDLAVYQANRRSAAQRVYENPDSFSQDLLPRDQEEIYELPG